MDVHALNRCSALVHPVYFPCTQCQGANKKAGAGLAEGRGFGWGPTPGAAFPGLLRLRRGVALAGQSRWPHGPGLSSRSSPGK